MAYGRYIFNFKGVPPLPADDIKLIQSKTQLVDASRKTLLVEGSEDTVMNELAQKLPQWTVSKETCYNVPTTKPNVQKSPKS